MMSCCSEGGAAAQRELHMVRIPIRSRIPLQGWALAGAFTILSAISSFLGGHDGSAGWHLAQLVE
jgi:hypothetical protein